MTTILGKMSLGGAVRNQRRTEVEPLIIGNPKQLILPRDHAAVARRAALRGNRSQQQARAAGRLGAEWKAEREARWAALRTAAVG